MPICPEVFERQVRRLLAGDDTTLFRSACSHYFARAALQRGVTGLVKPRSTEHYFNGDLVYFKLEGKVVYDAGGLLKGRQHDRFIKEIYPLVFHAVAVSEREVEAEIASRMLPAALEEEVMQRARALVARHFELHGDALLKPAPVIAGVAA